MIYLIGLIADILEKWFPGERPEDPYRYKERFNGQIPKAK